MHMFDSMITAVLLPLMLAGGAHDIASAFSISKSENKNQVHFAVHVDDACRPATGSPVEPYWRMLERGPNVTEPLLQDEQRVYGIASQTIETSRVTIRLRALSSRPITIATWKEASGACSATATTVINGKTSRLYDVHVVLGPFGVRHVIVAGWADDGSVVREQISP